MSDKNNQSQIDQQLPESPSSKDENNNHINWWIEIISFLAVGYLIFSLISPIFLKEGQQPRKIEAPDIIIIAIVLLFNSGLLNRIEDFAISKDGGFTAKFKETEARGR